jgi:YidC/Oxa1 family membrane protein insertase
VDFITLTIKFLSMLAKFVGNWGLAIILLTIIVRGAMWHLNVQQQRSMKMMQALQPKMKAIQDRYQSNPQMMQQKMMEFYKEHKFNPMGGCLPLLIQMPIFILLYSALISPQFITQVQGNQSFLYIKDLSTTMRATAGISNNGTLGIANGDNLILGNSATVYLPDETLKNVKVKDPTKAVEIQGELIPGEDADLAVSLDHINLKFSQQDQIEKAELTVTNSNIRESENIEFTRDGGYLKATVPTIPVSKKLHWDVVSLIILFAITMVISQKVMMAINKSDSTDPTQQALQKSMGTFMPLMIIATFVIIPIPAGVLLYLITSNVIQIIQTVIINKQIDDENAKKKENVGDDELKNAKKVNDK